MAAPKSILFVCTGNVFRSVAAEECFKKYLADEGITGWDVGSAGIIADPEPIDPKTLESLRKLGINADEHVQRRLTKDMLDTHDVVVAMAEDHVEFMKSEFDYRYAILFNELASQTKTSIRNVEDIPEHETNREIVEAFIEKTVKHIHDKIPALYKDACERFYLFSDFIGGKVTHRNGYPFITLYETPNSIAFMSIDIPFKEDGHILVIPKKRYFDLSDVPDEILQELIVAIKKVGQALGIDHGGYNVLLNNGLDAGQYMMHTHFHLIPRRYGDGIRIETWKRPPISKEDFIKLNEKLKQEIKGV